MAYKILLTSLYEADKNGDLHYFYAKDGGRNYYCDALTTVEASTKFVLSKHEIDEIVTIGRKTTFDDGDDGRLIELKSGKDFYTSDIRDLSTYSLYRYRIAQYIDELRLEQQDLLELLDEKAQDEVRSIVTVFAKEKDPQGKFNRFFDKLAQDRGWYEELEDVIDEMIPEGANRRNYYAWIKNYLWMELKDSVKMDLLPENEDVKVRFIPTNNTNDGKLPVENIRRLLDAIVGEHRGEQVYLYVALNSDDMSDSYVLMNMLDMIDTMLGKDVDVIKTFTASREHNTLTGEIKDDTDSFGITELTAAIKTFMNYGKADMLVNYWERTGVSDEYAEKMVYAMRRIDAGLSLCKISEMERGIKDLRDLFRNPPEEEPDNYYSRIFLGLAGGVRHDYGPLMEGDKTNFIDLVKWGHRKKFYQQTLTLIEARAPEEFVSKGIFYYCNSEEYKEQVINILAQIRSEMRPFEYWHMDNIDHYFLKSYERRDRSGKNDDPQRAYAQQRMRGLDNTDEGVITAFTACDDRQAVEDLLYAYYYIGNVRNHINHAEDSDGFTEDRLITEEKDEMTRLVKIREVIQYFINCYEKVTSIIGDRELDVVRINSYEVKAAAKKLEKSEVR